MPTTADLIHAAAMLVETSWEMTQEEFAERLEAFVAESTDKIAALRAVYKAAEGRAAACESEADLYYAAAKAHGTNADRVKARAFLLMEAAEMAGETLPGARLQANGGKVPLVYAPGFDATALPFDLQRVTVEANADAIRAVLAKGGEVDGVAVGVVGRHLRWTEVPAEHRRDIVARMKSAPDADADGGGK